MAGLRGRVVWSTLMTLSSLGGLLKNTMFHIIAIICRLAGLCFTSTPQTVMLA